MARQSNTASPARRRASWSARCTRCSAERNNWPWWPSLEARPLLKQGGH
jgi:hypothetical protein